MREIIEINAGFAQKISVFRALFHMTTSFALLSADALYFRLAFVSSKVGNLREKVKDCR